MYCNPVIFCGNMSVYKMKHEWNSCKLKHEWRSLISHNIHTECITLKDQTKLETNIIRTCQTQVYCVVGFTRPTHSLQWYTVIHTITWKYSAQTT